MDWDAIGAVGEVLPGGLPIAMQQGVAPQGGIEDASSAAEVEDLLEE